VLHGALLRPIGDENFWKTGFSIGFQQGFQSCK
jgi:hypothetical protein